MRYCMNFYLNWHRNCERSDFELSNLLDKKYTLTFHNSILLHKSDSTLKSLAIIFTIDWSFKMRYYINFYPIWHRNQEGSKLNVWFLLSKYVASRFDPFQFLCKLRQKFMHYLILKLQSMVKLSVKGLSVLSFLCSKTAL